MTERIRLTCAIVMIVSYLGIAACDFKTADYKTAILGVTFTFANYLIFLK